MRNIRSKNLTLGGLGAILALACGRGTDQAASGKSGDSAAMANMPGMSMPLGDSGGSGSAAVGQVTLTAAQIAHGGVRWDAVVRGRTAVTATVPGQVVANEDRTARLGAIVRGRVLRVEVNPGDRVSRGQVLVTVQSPEAGMAQSDLAKAEAQATSRRAQAAYAKSARDRAERLLALKAIPKQEYERAVADEELARAEQAQAEAELERARSTAEQLGASGAANGQVALRSPLAGVVLRRTAVPGTVVEAGTPMVVVTDPSSLWLSIEAPERYASLFRNGQRLAFTVPGYPSDSFVARVEAVGAGLEPATRTLAVRGVVSNGAGRLKPEMLASVRVEGAVEIGAVVVPEDAVQQLDGKSVVFVAEPDGQGGARFTAREVEVASRADGLVAVTVGLAPGDVVVTHGALAVKAELKKGSMPEMEM